MLRFQPRYMMAALLLCACSTVEDAKVKDADPVISGIQERISADTANWQLHAQLAGELRRKNRLEEAAQAASKAFELAPSPGTEAQLELAKVYALADRSAAAINLVKDAEKRKRDAGEPVDEVKIAEVYAVLGDVAAVFRWLDRAVTAGSPNLATLQTNPDLTSVHSDPRWAQVTAAAAAR
jgi:tetratricopeptide (TPR) repeat protein